MHVQTLLEGRMAKKVEYICRAQRTYDYLIDEER